MSSVERRLADSPLRRALLWVWLAGWAAVLFYPVVWDHALGQPSAWYWTVPWAALAGSWLFVTGVAFALFRSGVGS